MSAEDTTKFFRTATGMIFPESDETEGSKNILRAAFQVIVGGLVFLAGSGAPNSLLRGEEAIRDNTATPRRQSGETSLTR
jgi:hypothetical protein